MPAASVKNVGAKAMTDSQRKVLAFLQKHRQRWFRPSEIKPDDYDGGAAVIGRVLGSLMKLGVVQVRKGDRGNGTACKEYRAAVVQ
jgi:hypothetical protein